MIRPIYLTKMKYFSYFILGCFTLKSEMLAVSWGMLVSFGTHFCGLSDYQTFLGPFPNTQHACNLIYSVWTLPSLSISLCWICSIRWSSLFYPTIIKWQHFCHIWLWTCSLSCGLGGNVCPTRFQWIEHLFIFPHPIPLDVSNDPHKDAVHGQ